MASVKNEKGPPFVEERFRSVFGGHGPLLTDEQMEEILNGPDDPEIQQMIDDYLEQHAMEKTPPAEGG